MAIGSMRHIVLQCWQDEGCPGVENMLETRADTFSAAGHLNMRVGHPDVRLDTVFTARFSRPGTRRHPVRSQV